MVGFVVIVLDSVIQSGFLSLPSTDPHFTLVCIPEKSLPKTEMGKLCGLTHSRKSNLKPRRGALLTNLKTNLNVSELLRDKTHTLAWSFSRY